MRRSSQIYTFSRLNIICNCLSFFLNWVGANIKAHLSFSACSHSDVIDGIDELRGPTLGLGGHHQDAADSKKAETKRSHFDCSLAQGPRAAWGRQMMSPLWPAVAFVPLWMLTTSTDQDAASPCYWRLQSLASGWTESDLDASQASALQPSGARCSLIPR